MAMQNSPKSARHPSGLELLFHPLEHEYVLNGEKLTSVTRKIHAWFPQFDAEGTARRKAGREGGDYRALMMEWEQKRVESAKFGTKIHLMAETILLARDDRAADSLPENPREQAYLAAVKEALLRIERGYDFIECEKIVFSPLGKVAGTIDLLLRSKTTGEYVVADWKTNREIKYSGFRDEMGIGPCSSLANCNFIHYSLQASAYGTILTTEGYIEAAQPVRGVLLHLAEKRGRVVCDYIKAKDLSFESRIVLDLSQPGLTSASL
jgi:ATP-dependent exoDNAse (exonuclease V) beta subunit